MTDEQMAAVETIKEIARENSLVIAGIWSASDVANYYNENETKITLDEAEEMLFNWQKELKDNAITNGYHVISMMMESDTNE